MNSAVQALWEAIRADCWPNVVDENLLKSSDTLMQIAHQMWWLSYLLPLAIAAKVPHGDLSWLNVIKLLHTQQLCTSPIATSSIVQTLEIAIAWQNTAYQELYPDASYIPNFQHLVHLSVRIKMYGPACNHWCMRIESKNVLFQEE